MLEQHSNITINRINSISYITALLLTSASMALTDKSYLYSLVGNRPVQSKNMLLIHTQSHGNIGISITDIRDILSNLKSKFLCIFRWMRLCNVDG
jgi:hypothetical protein